MSKTTGKLFANVKTWRRTMKICKQVIDALFPFREHGLAANAVIWDASGRPKRPWMMKNGKRTYPKVGLLPSIIMELPADTARRFFCVHPSAFTGEKDESGPQPTEDEFAKFRRLFLGTARRRLLKEQVQRIKTLPRLPGPGRSRIPKMERESIPKRIAQLMNGEDESGQITKTRAVRILAARTDYSKAFIWKVLKEDAEGIRK